jgi:oligoribonuclease
VITLLKLLPIVTDKNLNILEEGPNLVINQPNEILNGMDKWNTDHHNRSGLVQKVLESNVTESIAEKKTIDFLSKYVPKGESPLCGNTICQDRRFLGKMYARFRRNFVITEALMLVQYVELGKRWYFEDMDNFQKNSNHRALDDIRDSIDELRYYRKTIFKL